MNRMKYILGPVAPVSVKHRKISRCFQGGMGILFGLLLVSSAQAIDLIKVNAMKPRLNHLVAPRAAIDLDGEWNYTTLKGDKRAGAFSDGTKRTYYEFPPVRVAATNWMAKTVPCLFGYWPYDKAQVFKRTFTVNQDPAGKRFLLRFEMVMDRCEVTLNGKVFGPHDSFCMPWDVDVSSAIKRGENEIILKLTNEDCGSRNNREELYIISWQEAPYMGIARPVHIEIIDDVAIDGIAIDTKVTPEKVFNAEVELRNDTDKDVTAVLTSGVEGAWRQQSQELVVPAKGSVKTSITQAWPDVKLWNPDTPNLYNLDLKVEVGGRVRDAYRQRFGFREVKIVKDRLTLNGHPFMNRRTTYNDPKPTDEAFRKQVEVFKKHGVVGLRIFPGEYQRWLDAADEYGMLVNTVACAPFGAGGKNPRFWEEVFPNHLRDVVTRFRNHPSLIYWGLGNEWGAPYAGNEVRDTPKEVAMGKMVESLDPTRAWTYHGEIELGTPVRGPGPCPLRSFHYPLPPTANYVEIPAASYWYDNGWGSWQGTYEHNKPLMVSEDLFHGVNDNVPGMAKWAGDSVYTVKGYNKAWFDIARMFAAGHYCVGTSAWDPWCTYSSEDPNPLYDDNGQLMPDYLIAIREFNPNFWSGEKVERTLYVYNQRFLPVDAELVCEETLDGTAIRTSGQSLKLDPGAKFEKNVVLDVPKVGMPSKYNVSYTLKTGNKILAQQTFAYFVYPETRIRIPRGTALLAKLDSPLRRFKFTQGVYDSVDGAIRSGCRQLVVDAVLSDADGGKLTAYVENGGRVLFIDAAKESWAPMEIDYKAWPNYVFRRDDQALPSLWEKSMRCWRPETARQMLGDSSYVKSEDVDCSVLFDCARQDGLRYAAILWFYSGKGGWLLTQLPLGRRLDVEPAAGHVLQALLDELAEPTRKLDDKRNIVLLQGNTKYKALFSNYGIALGTALTRNSILFVDFSLALTEQQRKRMEEHCCNGGTVFAVEPQTTDQMPKDWGLSLVPPEEKQLVLRKPSDSQKGSAEFVTRKNNAGLMAGISNDDLFWRDPKDLWAFFRTLTVGLYGTWLKSDRYVSTGALAATPGSKAERLTDPSALADLPWLNGRVVVSTLKFDAFSRKRPAKVGFVFRALFTNLGVKTSHATGGSKRYFHVPLNNFANRGFQEKTSEFWEEYNAKRIRKGQKAVEPVPGWFNNGNDMRYFPVNLCGWSPTANNFCPVDPFPTTPLRYQGIKFTFIDPDNHGNRTCVVIEPGEGKRIKVYNHPFKRIWFLGAMEKPIPASECREIGVRIIAQNPRINPVSWPSTNAPSFWVGDHLNSYLAPGAVEGGKIAWTGPSEKSSQAALYLWHLDNPMEDTSWPLADIDLTNKTSSAFVIVGMTLEQ